MADLAPPRASLYLGSMKKYKAERNETGLTIVEYLGDDKNVRIV